MTGIRKSSFINSIIEQSRRRNIPYDIDQLQKMSTSQLRKKSKEIRNLPR